jgi:5-methylcytosine-specific restriction endonuclease McrA
MQRAARDRDRHTCVRCGTTREEVGRELDVHHLRAVNTFDEANDANTLDNLVTLCHPCHMFIEWNGIDFTLPRGVTQCTTS